MSVVPKMMKLDSSWSNEFNVAFRMYDVMEFQFMEAILFIIKLGKGRDRLMMMNLEGIRVQYIGNLSILC